MLKLTESIGFFPLIGAIDNDRAKQLMETALTQGSELKVKYIIFDLSGVPAIDEWVASQIIRFVTALRLIGIEAELSGIRPEIAQKLVGLGIEFKTIQTFSNLQQAIDHVNHLKTAQK
ncbi:STAS domain-containing protein [Paraliobacillus sp. X-1268]|nr:STAS domain-containing protein [Paraliobacillus sp. X-1268]